MDKKAHITFLYRNEFDKNYIASFFCIITKIGKISENFKFILLQETAVYHYQIFEKMGQVASRQQYQRSERYRDE